METQVECILIITKFIINRMLIDLKEDMKFKSSMQVQLHHFQ